MFSLNPGGTGAGDDFQFIDDTWPETLICTLTYFDAINDTRFFPRLFPFDSSDPDGENPVDAAATVEIVLNKVTDLGDGNSHGYIGGGWVIRKKTIGDTWQGEWENAGYQVVFWLRCHRATAVAPGGSIMSSRLSVFTPIEFWRLTNPGFEDLMIQRNSLVLFYFADGREGDGVVNAPRMAPVMLTCRSESTSFFAAYDIPGMTVQITDPE